MELLHVNSAVVVEHPILQEPIVFNAHLASFPKLEVIVNNVRTILTLLTMELVLVLLAVLELKLTTIKRDVLLVLLVSILLILELVKSVLLVNILLTLELLSVVIVIVVLKPLLMELVVKFVNLAISRMEANVKLVL